jgi:hypothetical protein
MTLAGWLNILAIMLSPLVALQISRYLDRRRDKYNRRTSIFYKLMASRTPGGIRITTPHIEALNQIDIEYHRQSFFGIFKIEFKKDKKVLEAWKTYLDLLGEKLDPEKDDVKSFMRVRDEAFYDLLQTLSYSLGYDFDKVFLKNSAYYPIALQNTEYDQALIRKAVVGILTNQQSIPFSLTSFKSFDDALEMARKASAANPVTTPPNDGKLPKLEPVTAELKTEITPPARMPD